MTLSVSSGRIGALARRLDDLADLPDWQAFQDDYREANPDAFDTPTLQAVLYYNSFTSLMLALEENEGVVEENEGESLRATMSELTWESPIGGLSRNENRQAETSIFICEVVGTGDEQLGRSWSSRSTASSRATPCGSVWTGAPDAR